MNREFFWGGGRALWVKCMKVLRLEENEVSGDHLVQRDVGGWVT